MDSAPPSPAPLATNNQTLAMLQDDIKTEIRAKIATMSREAWLDSHKWAIPAQDIANNDPWKLAKDIELGRVPPDFAGRLVQSALAARVITPAQAFRFSEFIRDAARAAIAKATGGAA